MWWNAGVLYSLWSCRFQITLYLCILVLYIICKMWVKFPQVVLLPLISWNIRQLDTHQVAHCFIYLAAIIDILPKCVVANFFTWGVSETTLDTYYHQMWNLEIWKICNTFWVSPLSNQYDCLGYLGGPATLSYCKLP